MSPESTTPTRSHWYSLDPFAAAFFAALALGLVGALVVDVAGGPKFTDRRGIWIVTAIVVPATYYGRRRSLRILVPAMIALWLVVFALLLRAA